jgi:uncharacterized membrane protein
MENLTQKNESIKQIVMERLLEDGYTMSNKQWDKISNMPFLMTYITGTKIVNEEDYTYNFIKHYIDTYGLPTNDEIEVMNEIEKTILTQE